jgi:diadenosine tetraphosphate (Ap4A) HIT family hydrolase
MYDEQNVFARILRGEIPAQIVYDDEWCVAFHDISQAAPAHILVIPKNKYRNFAEFVKQAPEEEVHGFFDSVRHVAKELKVQESGYRLIMNSGADAHQTVEHFHVHILGGKKLGPLLASDAQLR